MIDKFSYTKELSFIKNLPERKGQVIHGENIFATYIITDKRLLLRI